MVLIRERIGQVGKIEWIVFLYWGAGTWDHAGWEEGEVVVIVDEYGRGAEVVVMSLVWSVKVGRIVIDEDGWDERRIEIGIGDEAVLVEESRVELMLTFMFTILPSAV